MLCQVVLKRLEHLEHWVRVWASAVLRLERWMSTVWARQMEEPTDGLVGLADDCLALVATRSQVNISPHSVRSWRMGHRVAWRACG